MKRLNLLLTLILAVLTLFTVHVNGQTKKGIAKTEKIFINKIGEIHDHGWNKLGYITKGNIIKNNQGKTIYFIDGNVNVIGSKGNNLWKAQKKMATITI
ncbi:MAG: hypothetical protein H7202_05985 [Pedobacter sp.]|nr:hypothetical protein [Pedobacter sp.]